MIRLSVLIVGILLLGWLIASLAFASLSLFQTLLDLPGRISDYFSERTERRERQRIARARAQIVLVGRKSSGQKG